jgi:hypothetical protein
MHECNAQTLILPPFGPKRWDVTKGMSLTVPRRGETMVDIDRNLHSSMTVADECEQWREN